MTIRVFAALTYVAFVASFTYFALFVAGLVVPRAIDEGPISSAALAVAWDLGLVAFFGVAHSLLARAWVKAALRGLVPEAAERSVFVLVASAQLALLCAVWRPLPAPVWSTSGAAAAVLAVVQAAGWGVAILSTFLIDHFELFGLRQAFGPPAASTDFRTPFLYRWVRHPMYLGMMLGMWSAPTMSQGRLLLAAAMSAYTVIGVRHEERDLVRTFGAAYRRYQARVPVLLPFLRWPRVRR